MFILIVFDAFSDRGFLRFCRFRVHLLLTVCTYSGYLGLTALEPPNPSLYHIQRNLSPKRVSSCEGVKSTQDESFRDLKAVKSACPPVLKAIYFSLQIRAMCSQGRLFQLLSRSALESRYPMSSFSFTCRRFFLPFFFSVLWLVALFFFFFFLCAPVAVPLVREACPEVWYDEDAE